MHPLLETLVLRYPDLLGCVQDIQNAVDILVTSFRQGGKLLVCGNGGSAADSEHIVGELMKGFRSLRPLPEGRRAPLRTAFPHEGEYLANHLQGALPTLALDSQSALMTALANDVAADMVFAQQVYGYGVPGDVVLGISTSGTSQNVIRALQVAQSFDLHTIGLTGADGGLFKNICDVVICVPWYTVSEVQEHHLPIYHVICAWLEEIFFHDLTLHRS